MSAAFLLIPDVRGGASDPQHLGWIEVLSYSQGRGSGSDFSITKPVDSTSAQLYQMAQAGMQFEGELDAVNNGIVVLHFGLKGAIIAGLQLGDHPTDAGAVEHLQLSCASVEVERR